MDYVKVVLLLVTLEVAVEDVVVEFDKDLYIIVKR